MGEGSGADAVLGSVDIALPAVQHRSNDGFAYFSLVPATGKELHLTGIEVGVGEYAWEWNPDVVLHDELEYATE
jgi:hypothetical protein